MQQQRQNDESMTSPKATAKDAAWLDKERSFQIRQSMEKAILRVKERRATAFDLHCLNTHKGGGIIYSGDPTEIPVDKELYSRVEEALEWEIDVASKQYWHALYDWLKIRDLSSMGIDVVKDDIIDIFESKSYEELCNLETQIRKKLDSKAFDPDYWNAVLLELKKIRLKRFLIDCGTKLLDIRHSDDSELIDYKDIRANSPTDDSPRSRADDKEDYLDTSPRVMRLYEHYHGMARDAQEERFYGEATDICLDKQKKLIKPRYVAFIRLQVIWTKYNQAHYTSANPPPPTPQGYRFHIFYPKALETPTYRTEADSRGEETQIVRFIAKPYRDLVFRIPAHKWELGHKQGFRCVFEDDTLTLDFYFYRPFYRR